MSEQDPAQPNPAEAPVDPLFTHPASPFIQTEAPTPVMFGGPSKPTPAIYQTYWVTYRTQIEFGLALVAYLMVLIGSATILRGNPDAPWKYYIAVIPAVPAAAVIWLFLRAISHLNELQKRIQVNAFAFSLGTTAIVTFGYGLLEGVGLPHLSWTYVLPLMAVLWGVGTAIFALRYR